MRLRLLLSALVATLVALLATQAWAAPDDTCTFLTTGDGISQWGLITSVTGQGVSCTGGGSGTPGANDLFIVPSGAIVNVDDDILFDGTTTGTAIDVKNGGALNVVVTDATDQIIIRLPIGIEASESETETSSQGLICRLGSTCTINGKVREFWSATPTLQAAPSASSYFTVGDIIPCPNGTDPDCNGSGDPKIVRFNYPYLAFDADDRTDSRLWDESLGDIDAVGDVLCFWDPDTTDKYVGADSGWCYEIDAVDSSFSGPGPASIDINVEQTNEACRREHVECRHGRWRSCRYLSY